MSSTAKKLTWKVFWDLQCPYSHKNWSHIKDIKQAFGDKFDFEIVLTSLPFHPQAFPAQCAASLIEHQLGDDAKAAFIEQCFQQQESYMNAAVGDATPSQVRKVFCKITKDAGLLAPTSNPDFTEDYFLQHVQDWEGAIKPAYTEHKIALQYQVFGTPKHAIDGRLLEATESDWGVEEWKMKLTEEGFLTE